MLPSRQTACGVPSPVNAALGESVKTISLSVSSPGDTLQERDAVTRVGNRQTRARRLVFLAESALEFVADRAEDAGHRGAVSLAPN